MDDARPPTPGPDPNRPGPLTRDVALTLLERGGDLLASGDFADAGAHFQRVVGFDDPAITAAALLGLGEAHYRLNDEDAAVRTWSAILDLPETPSTYTAWRNIAAARVRAHDNVGAIEAYRQADRRAPPEDKAEIANRLGWLSKETGDSRASRRYFSRARGDSPRLTLTLLIIAVTTIVSLTALLSDQGEDIFKALELNKFGVAQGEYWRLWSVTLLHVRPAPPGVQHVRAVHRGHDRRALVRIAPVPGLLPGLCRGRFDRQLRVRWKRPGRRRVGGDHGSLRHPARGRPDPPSGRSPEPGDGQPAGHHRGHHARLRLPVGWRDRQRRAHRRPGRRPVARRPRATDPRSDALVAVAPTRRDPIDRDGDGPGLCHGPRPGRGGHRRRGRHRGRHERPRDPSRALDQPVAVVIEASLDTT